MVHPFSQDTTPTHRALPESEKPPDGSRALVRYDSVINSVIVVSVV